MISIRNLMMATAGLIVFAAGGAYAASDWLKGSTEEQLKTLADIQPGLGTVMIEYSNRYTDTYYAAKGGNWGLAAIRLRRRSRSRRSEKLPGRRRRGLSSVRDGLPGTAQRSHRSQRLPEVRCRVQGGRQGL